jgi:hypothetical protein
VIQIAEAKLVVCAQQSEDLVERGRTSRSARSHLAAE